MADSPDAVGQRGRRRRGSGSGNRPNMSIRALSKPDLNLVLCGSDSALKASVSNYFRGRKHSFTSHQRESSSECVIEVERIHGHQIILVELPALNKLSEEEVRRETLNCVSLCEPGVHVFLFIVPVGQLTDEDEAEMEMIQKIFDSREHFMVLFTLEHIVNRPLTNFIKSSPESQRLISLYGGQYRVMQLTEPEDSRQIPELLDYIENMKTEPYSLQMYVKAQENRTRRETEEKYKEELKRMDNKIKEFKLEGAEGQADDQECLRIVLIGRTGNGKSATGNTILGRNVFQSELSSDSVTTVCQKKVDEIGGRSVAVVDTPGLFDTTLPNDQVVKEIMKCISLLSPGPHVFVIVLSLGRFTKEEADTVDLINSVFGTKAAQFSIVLFTRGDELKKPIEKYVTESKSNYFKKLISDCRNRYLVFNNSEKRDKTQVTRLLNMIEKMKNTNESPYFTNSMFEETEISIKKKMEEMLKEKEREIQAQIEKLEAKYDREMKDTRKRLKDEKQRADEERMKMKNRFFITHNTDREREKRTVEDMKWKHADEMRRMSEKYKYEARKQEEDFNVYRKRTEQQIWALEDRLQEQNDLLKDQSETLQYTVKSMKRKYRDDARREAEEFYKQQIWALENKLEEQNYQYDLLKDQFETLHYEIKLMKRKYQKKKGCVVM